MGHLSSSRWGIYRQLRLCSSRLVGGVLGAGAGVVTAASTTMDGAGHSRAFGDAPASLSDGLAPSESSHTFARMARGMLMELEDVNCRRMPSAGSGA